VNSGPTTKSEKLKDLLLRIGKECDVYTDWNEFRQYFTRRGYPIIGIQFSMNRNREFELANVNYQKKGCPGLANMSFQTTNVKGPSVSLPTIPVVNEENERKELWKLPDRQKRVAELKSRMDEQQFEMIFGKDYRVADPKLKSLMITRPEPFGFMDNLTDGIFIVTNKS
jgi:hypothetical protein